MRFIYIQNKLSAVNFMNNRVRESPERTSQNGPLDALRGNFSTMNQDKYRPLCDRFPNHCGVVDRLTRENSSFNEIVQDYIDVLDMLKKWHSLEGQIAESRIKEYRNLRRELELEIEQSLLDAVKSESP